MIPTRNNQIHGFLRVVGFSPKKAAFIVARNRTVISCVHMKSVIKGEFTLPTYFPRYSNLDNTVKWFDLTVNEIQTNLSTMQHYAQLLYGNSLSKVKGGVAIFSGRMYVNLKTGTPRFRNPGKWNVIEFPVTYIALSKLANEL